MYYTSNVIWLLDFVISHEFQFFFSEYNIKVFLKIWYNHHLFNLSIKTLCINTETIDSALYGFRLKIRWLCCNLYVHALIYIYAFFGIWEQFSSDMDFRMGAQTWWYVLWGLGGHDSLNLVFGSNKRQRKPVKNCSA